MILFRSHYRGTRPRTVPDPGPAATPPHPSAAPEFVEQCLCRFEIGDVEALCEPAVDCGEQVAGLGPAALVAPQPGKARGGAQLPHLGFLLSGDAEGLAI